LSSSETFSGKTGAIKEGVLLNPFLIFSRSATARGLFPPIGLINSSPFFENCVPKMEVPPDEIFASYLNILDLV
jgi:hypothetical protein